MMSDYAVLSETPHIFFHGQAVYSIFIITNHKFLLLLTFLIVLKRNKRRKEDRTEGGRWAREGKGKEKKEKKSSVLFLNANIPRGAAISAIPMSLATSNLTLINHANNRGVSF